MMNTDARAARQHPVCNAIMGSNLLTRMPPSMYAFASAKQAMPASKASARFIAKGRTNWFQPPIYQMDWNRCDGTKLRNRSTLVHGTTSINPGYVWLSQSCV